jgi:hypothetical protein
VTFPVTVIWSLWSAATGALLATDAFNNKTAASESFP